jgi:drug/metabolite transporter (DMT)-like permease
MISVLDLANQSCAKNGLALTSASMYTVINSLSLAWVALFSKLFLKTKFHWGQLVGIGLLLSGIFIFSRAKSSSADNNWVGIVLILIATVMDGLIFVFNEWFMNTGEESERIPGPLLAGMLGENQIQNGLMHAIGAN